MGCLAAEQVLEVGTGACALVWHYLHPDEPLPVAIQLLGEYDVWNHTDKRTLPFQYGMRLIENTHPNNIELWSTLVQGSGKLVNQIVHDGHIVYIYQRQLYRKYIKATWFDVELDGLRFIASNAQLVNSQLFDSMWDDKVYDGMLIFGFRSGRWNVSMYSTKENIDVSVIAKNRGGGGHKGASGFQCEKLPFISSFLFDKT